VAPEFFGNARIAYAFGGHAPTIALATSYLGRRPADRPLLVGQAPPYVAALAELRLTLSGAVPFVRGLGYRLSASYASTATGAYTAGPNLALTNNGTGAATAPPLGFAPVDRMSAFVGLRYDFGAGESQ
jgi:hypothetical protein